MRAKVKSDESNEVLGIVISRGKLPRVESRVSLYMWCDETEIESDSTTKAA